jgi:hypothetical protein
MRAIVFLTLLVASPALAADTFYDTHIAKRDGETPCYARTYDAAHLAAHPKQVVRRFFTIANGGEGSDGRGGFYLTFGFVMRDSDEHFAGDAYCKPKGDGAVCHAEGDGGSFTVSPRSDGLLLTVGDFLALEGSETFSTNLAESDDREFRLYRSPAAECDLDWRHPGGNPSAPSLSRPS